jgi:thioredoxin 2
MIIPCPGCGAKNRIPSTRLLQHPRCGQCKAAVIANAPVAVTSNAEFDEIIQGSPLPIVVDFWAPWCAPCRVVAPELDKLAKSKSGSVLIVKVDTQANPEVAARFGIQSIPTFVRFDGGKEMRRASGAMSGAQLAAALQLR